MKMIINVQDQIKGSWHQIIENQGTVRLDGALVGSNTMLHKEISRLIAIWENQYEGLTDQL